MNDSYTYTYQYKCNSLNKGVVSFLNFVIRNPGEEEYIDSRLQTAGMTLKLFRIIQAVKYLHKSEARRIPTKTILQTKPQVFTRNSVYYIRKGEYEI